ncbi:hypothetical protein QWZ14_01790 [Paeniroseomonas aquatica]|uniref:DotM C-terminal cytoplasmic domain-containing protein n=1 Tax=Paeniroseomonas aquatica TaxID=373043 RepID=A0ABT8A053_9PROT|nr:hypothetical protein [Paeniroseomonas aquatica]MDN3563108.1 hypothetical protein [Paeniroseomonas aquatica]
MNTPPPVRQNRDEDNLILFGLIVLMMAGLGWLLWMTFRPQLAAAVMTWHHWLIQGASLFTDRFAAMDRQLLAADPTSPTVTFDRLYRLAHNVGGFYSYPVAALAIGLAVWCWRRVGTARYRRRFDVEGLLAEQATVFPFMAAYVGRGLRPVNPAEGEPRPADPVLHAGEWVQRFARGPKGEFCERQAREEMMRQLGPIWTGVADAAPHVRAMVAAMALHAARRREDAVQMLGALSRSLPIDAKDGPAGPAQPLEFSAKAIAIADEYLRDPDLRGRMEKAAAGHAYTATALMSMLCEARARAGIFNPGMFQFLQMVDRRLFLALDSLGFPVIGVPWHLIAAQTPFAEAAAARSHWAAEREAKCRLVLPVFGPAIVTIRAKASDFGPRKQEHVL